MLIEGKYYYLTESTPKSKVKFIRMTPEGLALIETDEGDRALSKLEWLEEITQE